MALEFPKSCRNQRPSQYSGKATDGIGRLLVVAVDRPGEDRRAGGGQVRAELGRVLRAVVRGVVRPRVLGAAVGATRVAAAVPDVERPRGARVHPGPGLVREHLEAGVVGRVVDDVRAVVEARDRRARGAAGDESGLVRGPQRSVRDPVAEGLLVAHAIGPAVVARLRHLRGVLVRRGALGLARTARVGADPGGVGDVGLGIDREARGVAKAHRVDLGLGQVAAALGAVEQVRAVRRVGGRQLVGGADPDLGLLPVGDLVDRVEPDHLAVVVVGRRRRCGARPGSRS